MLSLQYCNIDVFIAILWYWYQNWYYHCLFTLILLSVPWLILYQHYIPWSSESFEVIVKRSNLDVVFFPGVHPQHHHWHAGGDTREQNVPDDHLWNYRDSMSSMCDIGRHDLQKSNFPRHALKPQGVYQEISSLGMIYPNTLPWRSVYHFHDSWCKWGCWMLILQNATILTDTLLGDVNEDIVCWSYRRPLSPRSSAVS